MLSNAEIEKYKQIIDQYNKAVADENAMQGQLAVLKKQAQEILQKYGCKKMSEISILQEKLAGMEEEIKQSQEEMLAYIAEVNRKKEEKDRILLG
jgi:rubrerythrin